MNSINNALAISFQFDNPWFLLVLIPGIILAFWPYFRIRKDKRRTRNRIVSMILHLIILTLATFVLSGFTIHEEGKPKFNETFILIDVSDSNYGNSDQVVNYVDDLVKKAPASHRIGIIAFGAGEPEVYAELQTRPRINKKDLFDYYDTHNRKEDGFYITEGTDIATALTFASKRFSDTDSLEGKRIILLTDGIETDGNAAAIAGSLGSRGLTIDAVYFTPVDYNGSNDMLISNFELENQSLKPEQIVKATTTIKSHIVGSKVKATVNIYDKVDGKESLLKTEEVKLLTEETSVVSELSFKEGGVHTIRVEIESATEQEEVEGKKVLTENNKYYSFAVVQEKSNKILVLYNKQSVSNIESFTQLFDEAKGAANGYEVVTKSAEEAPTNLNSYGEVILVDVDATKLPSGYDSVLNNYVTNGGGLLTTGGNNTYYNGGMKETKFRDFLPVEMSLSQKDGKAVVLCVDYSSAMCAADGEYVSYNGRNYSRKELLWMGIKKALYSKAFGDNTQVGIIFFGGKDNPIVALPLTDSTKISKIETALDTPPNEKGYMGNTEWRRPMEVAASMLNDNVSATTKHIIFITDGAGDKPEGESSKLVGYPIGGWKQSNAKIGQPVLDPNKCYTYYLDTQYGITLSSVAVYSPFQTVTNYVKQMAEDGGGNFYDVNNPDKLVEVIEEECKNIPTKLVNTEKDYTLVLNDAIKANLSFTDEDVAAIPDVNYYNGVETKKNNGAYNLITVNNEGGSEPIYAEWTYGSGRVGSLMTAITTFSMEVTDPKTNVKKTIQVNQDFLAHENSKKVIRSLVDRCFKSNVSGLTTDMKVDFEQDNFVTNVTVSDISNPDMTEVIDGNRTLKTTASIEMYYHDPDSKVDASINSDIDTLCPDPNKVDNVFWKKMNPADGSFSGYFSMMKPGLYTVAFLRQDDGYVVDDPDIPYNYVTFSYSAEYDTFRDNTDARQELEKIAANSARGQLITPDGELNPFSEEIFASTSDFNPVVVFMIIALILFILDVCARKFNFLWPHEWGKGRKTAD